MWVKTSNAGVIIVISQCGHPLQKEVENKRVELRTITKYLAAHGHPYMVDGDFNYEAANAR